MSYPHADITPDLGYEASPVLIMDNAVPGWRRLKDGDVVIRIKGHLFGECESRFLAACHTGLGALKGVLTGLDGCFGLIVETKDFVFAAADPIGSIPVFIAHSPGSGEGAPWRVAGSAPQLAQAEGLTEIDVDAALALAMAGYALGDRALVKGLRQLRAGELAVLRPGKAPEFSFYKRYQPWRVVFRPANILSNELAEILRAVFGKVVADIGDRPVMVPLSAGYDSRLVAAALKELGHRDIRCYAYGVPGNHEAEASRTIAERLGLPWQFVPVTPAIQHAYFTSAENADYVRSIDTMTAVPFNQDYVATRSVLESGYAPKDAVFINGQSGDFITGNHVPPELWSSPPTSDTDARWKRLFAAACRKHFDLWEVLKTPRNLARMAAMFREDLESQGGLPDDPALDWTLCEAFEFIHRQSRYVVAGQRAYEHFGVDWRLPLWDRDLVEFYETAPLSAKQSQLLYRKTLQQLNWGRVFGDDIPVNRRNVRPLWLVPLRLAAKAAAAPFGRSFWHAIERQYFAWYMDPVANYSVVPWMQVACDRRGFRNSISWHAEAYLARHGVALNSLATLQ